VDVVLRESGRFFEVVARLGRGSNKLRVSSGRVTSEHSEKRAHPLIDHEVRDVQDVVGILDCLILSSG
jgi:hypothetical protein